MRISGISPRTLKSFRALAVVLRRSTLGVDAKSSVANEASTNVTTDNPLNTARLLTSNTSGACYFTD
ncbi:MAG TPA: hypothetical protein PLX89_02965 [Verrucomicrobiota bacterium]|nr:hypothetical protein [Verrucomicrobiales bacterium]HRI11942.1 hypothetical protein [Verrucomicrobiota bacterium]